MLEIIIGYNINEDIFLGKLKKCMLLCQSWATARDRQGLTCASHRISVGMVSSQALPLGILEFWSWEEQRPFGPSVC